MKNKNIILSIGSYVVAIIWYVGAIMVGSALVANQVQTSEMGNTVVIIVFFALLFLGIFFGFKSNKTKESSWAGNLLMAIGIVVFLVYLLLMAGVAGGRP